MGSSSSKAARTVATTATRKYPSRPPGPPPPPPPASGSSRSSNSPSPNQSQGAASTPSYGPTVYPQSKEASPTRNQAINLDASDPDFAASLRSLGAVQPSPTLSHSSTFNSSSQPKQRNDSSSSPPPSSSRPSSRFPDPATNPAVRLLHARERLADEADREFAEVSKRGHVGRRFLDVVTLRQVLMLRDEKAVPEPEIERILGLKSGVVGRLGGRDGVVGGA
ncbi:MAG: hypothetical protein M1837_002456 [Sclerophora amabilis]|nr:MAG: hypothetical protein M1837_002456 [Sclerophora amabilis]